MKRFNVLRFTLFVLAAGLLATACHTDNEGITVSEEQLYGVWQKNGTEEFWSYREDGTGHTWDRADDIMNETDSGSVAYSWSISGDQLRHRFSGTNIGDMVVRTYTITAISASEMEREEEIGTYKLRRVE